jgi:general stress protein 26
MAKKSLQEISKKMKDLDFCMLTTVTTGGMTASRPMSNNREVEYDGNSYFFTWEKSRLAKDLKKNSHANLSFNDGKKLFVSVAGKAKLVKNPELMQEHWTKDLNQWFEEGPETPGVVMIHVKAKRIKYWDGEDEGEMKS